MIAISTFHFKIFQHFISNQYHHSKYQPLFQFYLCLCIFLKQFYSQGYFISTKQNIRFQLAKFQFNLSLKKYIPLPFYSCSQVSECCNATKQCTMLQQVVHSRHIKSTNTTNCPKYKRKKKKSFLYFILIFSFKPTFQCKDRA